ncbi:MAG TPA: phospholipid carrier-dependent glycosyltransferase [Thermodesulfovibrionales bacterium]|nr:phospholipid carrier-dependent glycosyltransferase [Thermodesulfovibrionales bacterium]
MKSDSPNARTVAEAVLWTVASLLLFYLLYHFRSLDDSRVSAWQDVFRVVDPLKTVGALVAALLAAFVVSLSSFGKRRPALGIFLLSFIAAACFWSEPELIIDASRYFTQAKHLELYGAANFFREWGAEVNAWTDLPAVPVLYGMAFRLFGEQRVVIQVLNTFFFSFSVVLTYLTGRELWDEEIGFFAGLFLLAIPYLYTQIPLMLVDVPAMFFIMLAFFTFIRSLRRGGVMMLAAPLSIFFAFFTKYSAWLLLTVVAVICAVELWSNRRKGLDRPALRGVIVIFASFFLISLAVAFSHDEMIRQVQLLLTFQKPGLYRWGESLLSIAVFQLHPVIVLFAAASVYFAIRRKDPFYIIIAWIVLLMIILQIRRLRYLVPAFPMLCLMASYGAIQMKKYLNCRFMAFSAAAFSFVIAFTAFLPFERSTSAQNIKDAAAYIDALDVQTVEVFTPIPRAYIMDTSAVVPLLDLFLHKDIFYQYDESSFPLPEDVETSAMRFTWTYRNPSYYAGPRPEGKRAVAIVSDAAGYDLPDAVRRRAEGFARSRMFTLRDDAYQHQTFITVYH